MDKLMEKLETDPNFRKFNTPLNSPTSQQRGHGHGHFGLETCCLTRPTEGWGKKVMLFLIPISKLMTPVCHITGLHTHIHICVQLQLLWASLVVQGIHLQWWRLGFSPWVGKIP